MSRIPTAVQIHIDPIIPYTACLRILRQSIAIDTALPDRTLRQYTEQHYIPAAAACHLRTGNKGAIGRRIVDWHHSLELKWTSAK